MLSPKEVERFSRNLILKGWDEEKQLKLRRMHVAVSSRYPTAALYIAALGVGKLTLIGQNHESAALLTHLTKFNPAMGVSISSSVENVDYILSETPGNIDAAKLVIDEANKEVRLEKDQKTLDRFEIPKADGVKSNLFSGITAALVFLRAMQSE